MFKIILSPSVLKLTGTGSSLSGDISVADVAVLSKLTVAVKFVCGKTLLS
jgi:hypothetical protein